MKDSHVARVRSAVPVLNIYGTTNWWCGDAELALGQCFERHTSESERFPDSQVKADAKRDEGEPKEDADEAVSRTNYFTENSRRNGIRFTARKV
jgi:hypothetical protein